MSNSRRAGYSIISAIIKVVFIIVVIMLTYRYGSLAYSYGYSIFNQTAANPSDERMITFTVTEDESVSEIGKDLKDKNLIKDADLFKLQEYVSNYHNKIAAGEYQLSPSMTPDEMIQIMAESSVDDASSTSDSAPVEDNISEDEEQSYSEDSSDIGDSDQL